MTKKIDTDRARRLAIKVAALLGLAVLLIAAAACVPLVLGRGLGLAGISAPTLEMPRFAENILPHGASAGPDSASLGAPGSPHASPANADGGDGWPSAYKPRSHSRAAGVSAAAPLVRVATTLPTVSTPPDWSGPFVGGVIDGVQTNDKVVALTFDDGPTAHTRTIVDTLDRFGDHATFFWVGSRITTDAATYSLAHGEELANHTWNHPNMWKLTSAEASAEIGLTSARIAQFTGAPPVWFRSPFNRVYPKEYAQIRAHGLLYANYNVTSVDWMKGVKSAEILLKLDENLRPGGVILMHDSPGHDPDSFLPAALELLRMRGYRVVTMTELAQMGAPVNEPLVLGVKGLGY